MRKHTDIGSSADLIQRLLLEKREPKAPIFTRLLESLDKHWPAWFAFGASIGGILGLLTKHGLI